MSSSDESHGFGQLGHGSLHELGTATLTENCDPRDLLLWGYLFGVNKDSLLKRYAEARSPFRC